MSSIYELMLQLPIFQGLSYEQLNEIIEKIPFDFCRYSPGTVIYKGGELCDHVLFVLNGVVLQETPSFGGKIRIVQEFSAPHTLSYYYLFGAETRSLSTLRAVTQVGMMKVDKMQFLKMLRQNNIMLVNAMNTLSTHAQKQHVAMEFTGLDDPTLRLASWLLAFTDRKAACITVEAPEEAWLSLLHMEAADFKRCVAILEGRGCVDMDNGVLKLIDRYALRHYVGEKSAPKW